MGIIRVLASADNSGKSDNITTRKEGERKIDNANPTQMFNNNNLNVSIYSLPSKIYMHMPFLKKKQKRTIILFSIGSLV
jgi:hypothetical protein